MIFHRLTFCHQYFDSIAEEWVTNTFDHVSDYAGSDADCISRNWTIIHRSSEISFIYSWYVSSNFSRFHQSRKRNSFAFIRCLYSVYFFPSNHIPPLSNRVFVAVIILFLLPIITLVERDTHTHTRAIWYSWISFVSMRICQLFIKMPATIKYSLWLIFPSSSLTPILILSFLLHSVLYFAPHSIFMGK